MKKIKYLLLGIVSLLGIGCSFGTYFNKLFYVDYNVLGTQNNSSFYLNSNDSRILYHFNDSNSYGYINPYFARQGNSINWDISNYSLQNNVVSPNYLSYFVPGFNSNGNSAVIIAQGTNSSRSSAIFPLTSSTTSYDSSYLDFSVSSVYFRIFGDSSCLNTDIITNSDKVFCTPNYIFYYDGHPYTRSSLGNIYDSQYDGVDYIKGPVQSSLGMGYSFAFVSGSGRTNGTLDSDSHLFFKTILFSGSEMQDFGGNLLFFKLNNSKYITGDDSDLLYMALQITGDISDYSLIYSIYHCNGSSLNSCVFSSGGFISNYQHLSGFNGGLLEFLSSPGIAKIWNTYNIDDNSFTFYGHYFSNTILNVRSYGLELLPTNGINIIDSFINSGGGGNQSFPDPIFDGGIFDANTYFIEEAIKCYITSGTVCGQGFTYEASENYVNNYEHGERNRNEFDGTGDLTFNNSVDMLSQYCLNINTIQYSFCSQLYLYEGYPITYYYNNGYFNYYIFGSGFTVNLGSMWSGQLGYAYCEGPYCSNFNQGLPQFIRKDTGDYSDFGFSGEYVSLDFFKNYFENGFFFQCPFSYSGSYFTIGGKLIDKLDKHDPLKPINCFIAAFSHGVKASFFGDSSIGLSHSGTLLNNTGPNAIRFYTFLDILLSLGYILFFSKLFKFLKKH